MVSSGFHLFIFKFVLAHPSRDEKGFTELQIANPLPSLVLPVWNEGCGMWGTVFEYWQDQKIEYISILLCLSPTYSWHGPSLSSGITVSLCAAELLKQSQIINISWFYFNVGIQSAWMLCGLINHKRVVMPGRKNGRFSHQTVI